MTQDTLATVDIDRPAHYTSHPSGVECREIARHLPFNIGCAFKYLFRAGLKGDAITDYRKALNYIKDELNISNDDALCFDYEKIEDLITRYINEEPNKSKKDAVSMLILANTYPISISRCSFLNKAAEHIQLLIDREISNER